VTSFAATFEQHSEGNAPALTGWVTFNSTFGAGAGVLANDTDVEDDPLLGATLVSGPAHGTLTFNGDGTFSYKPDANFNGTDSFTYTASDGRLDSNVATVTITVNPVNDGPEAADDSATTNEDAAVKVAVLGNDTDVDGDALKVLSVTQGAHGSVAINADGTVTYAPAANYNGSDGFTYTAGDGNGGTTVGTVNVTVIPVNDPPAAVNDSATTDEDTAVTVAVLANDADVDGDSLAALLVSGPKHGALKLNAGGTFTYTPAANYNGADSFTYKATDGSLGSNVATVSLTVNPVNDAPGAADDLYATTQGTPLAVAGPGVLANDTDVDGDALNAQLVSGPANGALTLNADGSFVYTPAAGFSGTDSFTYRAGDGSLSDLATVTLQVKPAPATEGKVTGGGINGAGNFKLNVQSRETKGGFLFSGSVAFQDAAHGIDLRSTSISYLRVESDGVRATISGTATVNGKAGYTFTVYLADRGEPARRDSFRIVVTGPDEFLYDSSAHDAEGLFESGNVQVHKK
jgi:VCBS repeat-containing protein